MCHMVMGGEWVTEAREGAVSRGHWGVCFKGPGGWGTSQHGQKNSVGGPGRQRLSPENLGLPPLLPASADEAR